MERCKKETSGDGVDRFYFDDECTMASRITDYRVGSDVIDFSGSRGLCVVSSHTIASNDTLLLLSNGGGILLEDCSGKAIHFYGFEQNSSSFNPHDYFKIMP